MNHLKMWRLERGFSQHVLASVSGVPRHVIQLAEGGLGRPINEHLSALAKTLGVPVAKLFPQPSAGSSTQSYEKGKSS